MGCPHGFPGLFHAPESGGFFRVFRGSNKTSGMGNGDISRKFLLHMALWENGDALHIFQLHLALQHQMHLPSPGEFPKRR
jgi:hypothetical protein